jgi:chromate transporter
VIASLAVFFGGQVFLAGGKPHWPAIAIGAAASIALLRYKVGTIPLILACAAAGLVLSYWHV